MNKLVIYFLVGLLASCSLFERKNEVPHKMVRDQALNQPGVTEKAGLKYRLLILPFLDASTERPVSFREGARKRFIIDLNRTGQLMALPSEDFKITVKEDPKSHDYLAAQVSAAAQNLGVSGVLEGKVLDFKVKRKTGQVGIVRNLRSVFECVIRIRIFAVRGGKEIFNTVKTVSLEQEDVRVAERIDSDKFIETHPELTETMIQEAFLEFTPQIVKAIEKLQWEGRIAAVQGDRIYLNVGRLSGLKIGDILKVIDEGDEVYDPETGQRIGQVQGRLKGTLEVVSFFGQDGSVAVIHSGAGFKENDHVELY